MQDYDSVYYDTVIGIETLSLMCKVFMCIDVKESVRFFLNKFKLILFEWNHKYEKYAF